MKKIFIILIVLKFIACLLSKEEIEKLRVKRKERDKNIAECILKSDIVSEDLKKKIKENEDKNLVRILHPHDHKLDKNDQEVIRNCTKEVFLKEHRDNERMNIDNL